MSGIATGLVLAIGVLHICILIMEMGLWQTPRVRKVFGTTPEFAASTKSLAANQGLYNGFLAAGLFWGLWQGAGGRDVLAFFLICVLVAGLFGAMTVSKRIFFVQALPAILALTALTLA